MKIELKNIYINSVKLSKSGKKFIRCSSKITQRDENGMDSINKVLITIFDTKHDVLKDIKVVDQCNIKVDVEFLVSRMRIDDKGKDGLITYISGSATSMKECEV